MKKGIIVLRELEVVEINIIQQKASEGKVDIYSLPDYVKYFDNNVNVTKLTIDDKNSINYNVLDRLLALGDKKIGEKTVSEHLTFSKYASIWYYHKFRINFLMRNKQYEISLLKPLLIKFDEIEVYSNYNLEGFFNSKIFIIYPVIKKHKRPVSFLKYGWLFILKVFLSILKPGGKHQKHLVLDRGIFQPIVFDDMSVRQGNYNLEYLLQKLDKTFAIMHESEVPKLFKTKDFGGDISSLKNRNPNAHLIFGEMVLFKCALSFSIIKSLKRIGKQLQFEYNEVLPGLDDDFEKDVLLELQKLHKSSIFYIFRYLCYDRFFKARSFVSVTSIDENSPLVKTILDAAKANGVSTIGIQHGNISDLSPAYMYTKNDHNKQMTTDKTLVWGDYWKRFLIEKAHFPESGIHVTGQLRTDIIPTLINSKEAIFDRTKKNIVFASQPIPDPVLKYQAALDVFKAAMMLGEEYFFWIKPHPAEINDLNYYSDIARKIECTNYKFVIDNDLYKIISSCDVLITCYSTVGTEAVYFKKPLVILDHLKQDLINYHKLGVAFQVINAEELNNIIKKIISGEVKINQRAYEKFIRDYAYKIDGDVVKRILNFIKES